MRGTREKKIRREVFGDDAHRDTKYAFEANGKTIRCTGNRARYQAAKKVHNVR